MAQLAVRRQAGVMTQIDRRAFLAAVGASAAVPSTACAGQSDAPAASAWTPNASLPWPVQEIYAAVDGGSIITGGGLVAREGGAARSEGPSAGFKRGGGTRSNPPGGSRPPRPGAGPAGGRGSPRGPRSKG